MFGDFFDGIKTYKASKFDRKTFQKRVNALPKNYKIVFNGISNYMWSSCTNGSGVTYALLDVLSLFENSAKNGKSVFDITGENIIGYADGLLQKISETTWLEKMKSDLNKGILEQLEK